jgi:hypothetical protein
MTKTYYTPTYALLSTQEADHAGRVLMQLAAAANEAAQLAVLRDHCTTADDRALLRGSADALMALANDTDVITDDPSVLED